MLATSECTSVQTDLDGVRHCAVGCRVHHKMPDGCVAADHEVACACTNFVCDHEVQTMERLERDEDGEYVEQALVCAECKNSFVGDGWHDAEQ